MKVRHERAHIGYNVFIEKSASAERHVVESLTMHSRAIGTSREVAVIAW
jgi:hypothetical protein